jgi:hypothetical protein
MAASHSHVFAGGLRRSGWFGALAGVLACLLMTPLARAQWATQAITLQPGWNAVYLEVQPEPRDCDSVFGGLPVESVWAWNRRFASVQYLTDASKLLPGQPDWLTYFPAAFGDPAMTTLFAVHGGRSYLVKCTASQPVTWRVHGRPVVPTRDWVKGSLNLAGFPLNPTALPTFGKFFASSPAHAGQAIFRLQPTGLWERVASPTTTTMRPGEAFWIYTTSPSTFTGPLAVETEQSRGIDYGRTVSETVLSLRNPTSQQKTVTLTPYASEDAPDFTTPALAGHVPLALWRMDLKSGVYGFYPLDVPYSLNLAAGEQVKLRLAVRRPDMAPYALRQGPTDYLYQSLLAVGDDAGTRVLVPVTARGGKAEPNGGGGVALSDVSGGGLAPEAKVGLWVGTAVIRAVSQPASPGDPSTPRPTGSEAQFRLIIHVNQAGQARLLQQVTLMWTNGAVDLQGNLDRAGRRVLVTDDALLPRFTGAALRDGKPVGRRISAVAFSHPRPIVMNGAFSDPTAAPLSCQVVLGYDDPLNPFKHRFHPDHDNLDEARAKVLGEGLESFTVTRVLSLRFTDTDPEGLATSRWGDSQIGGEYTETLSGLHKTPIVIRGIFRLSRVSLIPFLDTEG